MDNFLLYLLKVSAGTTLFYLLYLLFFSKDTFYKRNRIFLILTLILPVIFPAIKIPVLSNSLAPSVSVNAADNFFLSDYAIGTTISGATSAFDYNRLFILVYSTVAGLLLLRVIISLISTYTIIKKGFVKDRRFPKVIISDNQLPPFSFFPFAVIPVKDYVSGNYSDILDHEFAHIRQGHTFDLLLSELFIAFQWFNPLVWLIKRSVILNHEFLADHVSVSNKNVKEYQYRLLNFQTGLKHISLAHSFNSLIKNRIIMINKKPTRKYATLKNILIIPVVAILFVMFSFKPETNLQTNAIQQPLFTKTSESEILKFIARNTKYPQEAKTNHDTGSVFVVLKMGKGGKIITSNAITQESKITVHVLKEVVIVAFIPPVPGQEKTNVSKAPDSELPLLKAECIRVVNTLGSCEIAEWKDKDMEFAIAFKFILK